MVSSRWLALSTRVLLAVKEDLCKEAIWGTGGRGQWRASVPSMPIGNETKPCTYKHQQQFLLRSDVMGRARGVYGMVWYGVVSCGVV